MPSDLLDANIPRSVAQYSVVAEHLDDGSNFVRHVGLLRKEVGNLRANDLVEVWHCGPPVVAGERTLGNPLVRHSRAARARPAHIIGTFDINADDQEGIGVCIAEIDDEQRPVDDPRRYAEHYVAYPHMKIQNDEEGRPLYRRFNCVGFVLECYEFIEIFLIDWSAEDQIPHQTRDDLRAAYGDAVDYEPSLSQPRPVLLAGYVIHGMNYPSEKIRDPNHLFVPNSREFATYPLR